MTEEPGGQTKPPTSVMLLPAAAAAIATTQCLLPAASCNPHHCCCCYCRCLLVPGGTPRQGWFPWPPHTSNASCQPACWTSALAAVDSSIDWMRRTNSSSLSQSFSNLMVGLVRFRDCSKTETQRQRQSREGEAQQRVDHSTAHSSKRHCSHTAHTFGPSSACHTASCTAARGHQQRW